MVLSKLWRKKGKRRASALSKQNPLRPGKILNYCKLVFLGTITATVLLAPVAYLMSLAQSPLPKTTKIHLVTNGNTRNTSLSLLRDLYKKVRQGEATIKSLAESASKHTDSRDLALIRTHIDSVVIRVADRQPILGLELETTGPKPNKVYYLSNNNIVYPSKKRPKGIRFLRGLNLKDFKKTKKRLLRPTKQTGKILQEALSLSSRLNNNGIAHKGIQFDRVQGFKTTLEAGSTVNFGRSPFEKKILHLRKLLRKIKFSNLKVDQIDLDYNGKAFITESQPSDRKKGI